MTSDDRPRRSLHSVDIFFLVVAAAAPMGSILGNGALGTLLGNGAGMPGSYLIAGIILILFSVGFVKMSPQVHGSGAFYAYIRHGLGGVAGGASAYVALLSYIVMVVGSVAGFGFFGSLFLSSMFGLNLSWAVLGGACLIITGFVGYREITVGARLLSILLTFEVLILIVLMVAVFWPGSAAIVTTEPFRPATVLSGNFGVGLMFAFVSFLGYESAAIYSEEAKEGTKTVSRALITAVLFIAAFYAASMWSVISAFGPADVVAAAAENPGTLVYRAFDRFTWPVFTHIAEGLMVTSALAATIALHNAASRYFFSLSREGLMPPAFGRLHPVLQSPHIASLMVSVTCTLLVALFVVAKSDPLLTVLSSTFGLAALGIVVLQAVTSLSVLVFSLSKNSESQSRRIDAAIALVSTVALSAVALLIAENYAVLTGDLGLLDYAPWLLPVAAIIGASVSVRRKRALATG